MNRRPLGYSAERLLTIGYLLVAAWVLLGRPNVRIQLLAAIRKGLRAAAAGASNAADTIGDTLIDLGTANH